MRLDLMMLVIDIDWSWLNSNLIIEEKMDYPVDNHQLTIYLVFTCLSIVASLIVYFAYQHCLGLAEKDHQEYLQFFIDVGN